MCVFFNKYLQYKRENMSEVLLWLTLDDGQEDDNDKEEKCDVKDHSFHLKLISSWILDLITNSTTRTHSHIHVEHVTLGEGDKKKKGRGAYYCIWQRGLFYFKILQLS